MTEQDQARLAAYDAMYAGVLREREAVLEELERLRASGKQKGATYRQLLAQKMMLQDFISRLERCGNTG